MYSECERGYYLGCTSIKFKIYKFMSNHFNVISCLTEKSVKFFMRHPVHYCVLDSTQESKITKCKYLWWVNKKVGWTRQKTD